MICARSYKLYNTGYRFSLLNLCLGEENGGGYLPPCPRAPIRARLRQIRDWPACGWTPASPPVACTPNKLPFLDRSPVMCNILQGRDSIIPGNNYCCCILYIRKKFGRLDQRSVTAVCTCYYKIMTYVSCVLSI